MESVSSEGADGADLKRTRRVRRRGDFATPNVDRLPPHSIECEMGVLGCILISPNECLAEVMTKIKFKGEEFYDLRHQSIYKAMVEMREKGTAIDVTTLYQHLKDGQIAEQVGGAGYIATLPDAVPSAANLSYYLDHVLEKFQLRKMIQTCTEVVASVYEFEGEVDQLLDQCERDVLSIRLTSRDVEMRGMKELINKAILTVEQFHANQGMLTGIATGFADLDKMTSGLHGGEMIVIAARPSMGKTSIAMNIAEHVAVDQKIPTGVFSLEMTADQLTLRMLCSRARVNIKNVKDGFLAERDFSKLTVTAGKISVAPLYIDDSSGLSIMQLRARARRMHQQYGIKLFVIDYMQLLHSDSKKCDNRQQEIADISSGIKALSKELDVPVIVLSQMNREVEKEKGRKPKMSDLRESGAIEQDADVVGLLYKPAGVTNAEQEEESSEDFEVARVNLLIAKQRNGPTGDIYLTFIKSYTRFENAARVSDNDVPDEAAVRSSQAEFPQ